MPTIRLTEISVRALKPTNAYVTYWSDQLPGFGLRVGRRSRTWTVMRGRQRERLSIGRYPDMSLSDARSEAKRLLIEQPEPKALPFTFAQARDRFLQEHYRDRAASTKQQVSLILKRHFKALDHRQLVDLDDRDMSRALDKLADRPSAQLHAYRIIRCFLSRCTKPPRRFIPRSPMEGYAPPGKDRKGTRVLTDDELVAVWKASETGSRALFRLLILWGTRNTETCLLEPAWRSGDVLTIPGEATKNGRDHGIPLLPLADNVLASLPADSGYYFPGRWGEGHLSPTSLDDVKDAIQKTSGTSGWQIRDIRRTFRSNMARLRVPREVCEVLINHAPPVLDEIYDRYDRITEKREALAKHESFILSLIARQRCRDFRTVKASLPGSRRLLAFPRQARDFQPEQQDWKLKIVRRNVQRQWLGPVFDWMSLIDEQVPELC